MIHIELPTKMLLDTQLREIAPKLNREFGELESLMNGTAVLLVAENGDAEIVQSMTVDKDSVAHLAYDAENGKYLCGADAVAYLCKQADTDLKLLEAIDIPSSVFRACHPQVWYDICKLAERTEWRAERIKKLSALNAPPIIMLNENRMLYDAICALEHNFVSDKEKQSLCRNSADKTTVLRSLNTVGYSLVWDWSRKRSDEERLLRAIFGKAQTLKGIGDES